MDQHVKIVAIIYLIFGILGIGLALIVFVFGAGAAVMSQDRDSALAGGMCATILAAVVGVLALPSLIAGWGLTKRKQWARILTIVLAVLQIFNFPVGTAIGGYTLWVMFQPETQTLFS